MKTILLPLLFLCPLLIFANDNSILDLHENDIYARCEINYRKNEQQSMIKADSPLTVYLISGQGADHRLFNNLKLNKVYQIKHITYELPKKRMKLVEYAHQLAKQIDTTQSFAIIGVSLGGMIATEMADFLQPKQVIVISSAKCKFELPKKYTFQKHMPLYKLFPGFFYKIGAQFFQPIFEHDRKKEEGTFKQMLKAKNPKFLKRTVNMIINWERTTYNKDIVHIHGSRDKTLPTKRVKYDILIEGGSHLMTLTQGDRISLEINQILSAL